MMKIIVKLKIQVKNNIYYRYNFIDIGTGSGGMNVIDYISFI